MTLEERIERIEKRLGIPVEPKPQAGDPKPPAKKGDR